MIHTETSAVDHMVGAGDERSVFAAHEEDYIHQFIKLGGTAQKRGHSGHGRTREYGTGSDAERPHPMRGPCDGKPLDEVEKEPRMTMTPDFFATI